MRAPPKRNPAPPASGDRAECFGSVSNSEATPLRPDTQLRAAARLVTRLGLTWPVALVTVELAGIGRAR